jgi:ribonucleoside-triphosphate reductase
MAANNSVFNIPLKVNKDFNKALLSFEETYGEDFEVLNGFAEKNLNFTDFIDAFTAKNAVTADVTIDANANASTKDIRALLNEKDKPLDKIFAFNKLFLEMKQKYGLKTAREWLNQEYSGGFYLHDACTSTYMGYCFAYDLTRLAKEGLFFLKNYNNVPPKHLTTFLDDVIEFVSFMSNRSSGAVGIPNILVWTYYFWRKDVQDGFYTKDPDSYLRQAFQKLIYRLNQPFMRIDQTAFVNVSIFDRQYCESLFGGLEYPDGTLFIDCVEEFIKHQKIFMEVVSQIRSENMFTFPVLTFSLQFKDGKFVDEDFARWCSDHNTEWNDSNFFVSKDVTTLSNCCRLLSDTSKLKGFMNSIGGTSLSIGSIKVNTINLVRIAIEAQANKPKNDSKISTINSYLKLLKKRTELCCKLLDVQRSIIEKNVQKGLLPNYCDGGIDINHQYSTIGILGLYETIKEFGFIATDEFGNKSYTDEGIKLAQAIFDVINDVKDHFTDKYTFNIESVPAERAAVILCQKDNLLYDKNDDFIYSNQWIPLKEKCTIKEKIRLSAVLDPMCSGGAIAHINIESKFPTKDAAWETLNKIANAGVIYFAYNARIGVCEDHHGFVGSDTCPVCGKPMIDQYTRVVGFLTRTGSWSKDRRKEFDARKWYEYASELKDL